MHNTTRYDLRGIRNYVIFLLVYLLCSVGISILNLTSAGFYCGTAPSQSAYDECNSSVTITSLIHLIGTAIITPLQIVLFSAYYRAVVRHFARLEAAIRAKRNYVFLRESL